MYVAKSDYNTYQRYRPCYVCVTSCVNAACAHLLWPLIIGVIGIVQSRLYETSVCQDKQQCTVT